MALSLLSIKAYVPAKDFDASKRFYQALGFSMSDGWGETADFELSGFGFRLQNYYNREWAENSMLLIDAPDIEAWHQRIREMLRSGDFSSARFKAPEQVDGSTVLHVWDPSGVLLIFVG